MSLFALFSVSYHADYDTVICHNCHVLSIEIATTRGENFFYEYPQKPLPSMPIDRLRISDR